MKVDKHFDIWSLIVIASTLVLFVAALFIKGLSHDLLVEAGVFMVSVKLIRMAYKHSVASAAEAKQIEEVLSSLRRLEGRTREDRSDVRRRSVSGRPRSPRLPLKKSSTR